MADNFKNHHLFYAVATLIGMIIGAGTFGIPYVFARTGFIIGSFYLLILGYAVLQVHLFYGEIILRTQESHRLVGYANKYLGNWAKRLATGTVLLEYYGSLLVYIILGGQFLNIVLGRWLGGSEILWALIFFAVGVSVVFFGIKTVAKDEFFMVGFLLLTVSVLLFRGLPLVNFGNFYGINLKDLFLPYGVILFALAGSAAIPEVRQILRGQEQKLKKAVIWGTLIPAGIYFLFAAIVVGVAGQKTTEDAILGLVPHFGSWVVDLGAIFGVLAVVTSFLSLGLATRDLFWKDYGVKKNWSFVLSFSVPLLLYIFGPKSFILIIGFLGAIAAGLDGILTVLIYLKAKKLGDRRPEYNLSFGRAIGAFLLCIFALGFIYQLFYLAGK